MEPLLIFPDGMSESTKELMSKIAEGLSEKHIELKGQYDKIKPEFVPEEGLVYIEDSPFARDWMLKHFQESKLSINMFRAYCYIKFNTKTLEWSPIMEYQWLYVPEPKLEELENLLLFKN